MIVYSYIKHTINAGHHGKLPNLHQTISPGSYRSALGSLESTDRNGLGIFFVELRPSLLDDAIFISDTLFTESSSEQCVSGLERR